MYQRRRARLLLIALVITSLVLVTLDFRAEEGEGPLDQLRAGASTALRPVQEGLDTVLRPVGEAASSITGVFSLRADNERLQQRVERLEARQRSATDLERENEELRGLLDLDDRDRLDTVAARTVGLAPSNFEWTITIDVGSEQGIERDMPVINDAGLVGRVIQAGTSASRVLLAIDPNFWASAREADSGQNGSINGRGGDPMLFTPLDPEAELEQGDEIVTAPYEGGLYPGGIPIGTIADPGETATRLVREAEVRPFVDFTSLDHVLVVRSSQTEELEPFRPEPDPSDEATAGDGEQPVENDPEEGTSDGLEAPEGGPADGDDAAGDEAADGAAGTEAG